MRNGTVAKFWPVILVAIAGTIGAGELRDWRSEVGGYQTRAEMVRVTEDNAVILRREDGVELRVPLERLCLADRNYVAAQKSPAAAATAPDSGLVTAEQVEEEAETCKTAKLAVLLYQSYLNGNELSTEERRKVEQRLPYWRDLASRDYIRFGKTWMSTSEAKTKRDEAHDLVLHAVELLRLHSDQLAKSTLESASRIDPESIKAEFLMGYIYAMVVWNDVKAVSHFAECLRRDPNNISVLNNIAVSEVFIGRYAQALQHWKAAVELSPKNQLVADNLACTIELHGRKALRNMPPHTIASISELYRKLLNQNGIKPPDRADSFYYTLPYGRDWEGIDLGGKGGGSSDGEKKVESVITGGGSGFVVAPHYILTNHHVIEKAGSVLVLDPKSKNEEPLPAQVVAELPDSDLAIVKCEKLDAPPVPLAIDLPRRGTDVMVLGYPEMFAIGYQLKSTRGTVTALPDPTTGNFVMLDAAANPGNSGGPVCDQSARVVCVLSAVSTSFHNNYALGVPITTALPFLAANIPDFKPVVASQETSWPDVDARISPSTVLILRKENRVSDVGLNDRTKGRTVPGKD